MKKKIISVLIAAIMIMGSITAVSAADPTFILNTQTYSVNAENETFVYDFKLGGAIPDHINTEITVSLAGSDELTKVSGRDTMTLKGTDQIFATHQYTFRVPEDVKSDKQYVTWNISYKYPDPSGAPGAPAITGSCSVYSTVNVNINTSKDPEKLIFQSITYDDEILVGEEMSITAVIANNGKGDASNAVLKLYDTNGKTYASASLGKILAGENKDATLKFIAPKTAAFKNLRLALEYLDPNQKQKNLTANLAIDFVNSKPLVFTDVNYSKNATIDENNTVTFKLINKSNKDFTNCTAYLFEGDTLLTSSYIGKLETQKETAGKLTYNIKRTGNHNLKLLIHYYDTANQLLTKEKQFSIYGISAGVLEKGQLLKIQNISATPIIKVGTEVPVKAIISNPSSTEITGVEAFIYDSNGNVLDSTFIPKIEANAIAEPTLRVIPMDLGTYKYNFKIRYLNDQNEKKYLEKDFTVNSTKDGLPISNEAGDIRIQKINNPKIIYCNVTTPVKFIVANAGEGTAKNIELIVTDENGTEYGREYIGNLKPGEATPGGETSFDIDIKLPEEKEYNLIYTFNYENENKSTGSVAKTVSQKVAYYKATISSIAGYDYVMAGMQFDIEFSFVNGGTSKINNVNAVLTDEAGTEVSKLYIGVMEGGAEKARQRFKKLSFPEQGDKNMTLTVTFENTEFDTFTVKENFNFTVQAPMVMDEPINPDIAYDENGNPIDPNAPPKEEGGFPLWAWFAIGGGAVLIIVAVIVIIVVKKKKANRVEDDLEFFYSQNGNPKEETAKEDDAVKADNTKEKE